MTDTLTDTLEDTSVGIPTDSPLAKLSDMATEAHTRIQTDFDDLDPVIGVTRSMRKQGVPADAMTVDCLRSGKRIILILHDEQPGSISYQYSLKDEDPGGRFETMTFTDMNADKLYQWIHEYFHGTLQ